MKTSQIKKFVTQQPKPIKLKFENIKSEEANSNFSHEDLPNINFVFKTIQQALVNDQKINQDSLRLAYQLIKRLKKMVSVDNNKIRFCVVKSAKKSNALQLNSKIQPQNNEQSKLATTVPTVSLSQNRMQSTLVDSKQNKQNCRFTSNQNINGKELKLANPSIYTGKPKLKKIDTKPLQITQVSEMKIVSQQELNMKLRDQLKKLVADCQEKDKINQSFENQVEKLQKQIVELNKKIEQKEEALKIDLKYSLKCLQSESGSQAASNLTQSGLNVKTNNEQCQVFTKEYTHQLQLMVVSQSKQVEALHKKMLDQQGWVPKPSKKERWNCY